MSAETVNILNMRQLASGRLQAVCERRNSLNKGAGLDVHLTVRRDLQQAHSPATSGSCHDRFREAYCSMTAREDATFGFADRCIE